VPNHLFIVSQPLLVATSDGGSCGLTSGAVLSLIAPPDDDAISANLTVSASRKGDCPANSVVSVGLADLQDIQNDYRYQLDRGLQSLNSLQGTRGIPVAPAVAYDPAPKVSALPPAVSNAKNLVNESQLQADQSEVQVMQVVSGN
jgi:hypothetical protein